ncbi:MAG: amino acid adenylation domain-containing protein [Anaerolineae bacterium]
MGLNDIQESYQLSPMQQGLLFHTLYAPGSGVYIQQAVLNTPADLNVSIFARAWQRVVARHPVLRTSFRWQGLDRPRQEVHRNVDLPLTRHDWRDVPAEEQEQRLRAYLTADRRQGFALTDAPLLRLALFRLGEAGYRCLLTYHHLLLDTRSLHIVLREVSAFYQALPQGRQLELEQPRPFRDYIDGLRARNRGGDETFWRERLRGITTPTPLVVDQTPGPASGREAGYETQETRLPAAVTAALQALSREQQLPWQILIQGAWAILLSRYSGETDVVFGTTVDCRRGIREGLESTVGLLINALPVRARLPSGTPVLSCLNELHRQDLALRDAAREHTPLVEVQGWSDVPPGQALFESLLVFEDPLENNVVGQADSLSYTRLIEQTNYPLTVYAYPGPELRLKIAYDGHRFDEATVARMLGHLQTLLAGIAADPGQPVSRLPLLTEAERRQVLVVWNDTAVDPWQNSNRCLHQLVEAQVERTPEAIAVAFENQRLTYRELNRRANRLAHYLRGLGVGPEALAGVYLERSLEMVVAVLGVLKAGGAYVPLDPDFPQERLSFMLEDAQARILLTQARLAAESPDLVNPPDEGRELQVVCLDTDWDQIAHESSENPAGGAGPENLAYVIYTSGSTGKPKGVQIPHRAVVNFLHSMAAEPGLTADDILLAVTTLSFDIAVLELFLPLAVGGRVALVSRDVAADGSLLIEALSASGATVMQATPATWRLLLAAGWSGNEQLKMLCGGEALPRELADRLLGKGASLWNLYGPTETTIWSALYRVEAGQGPPPIGRPIANTQIYILDEHLQPVPAGVPGELFIGGPGLARGYLNRPHLTRQRFIPHPFSNQPLARLYRSGDRARFLPNGDILFLGRLDHQVKVRGFRIELGEIEARLAQHPALQQALVIARQPDHDPLDTQLVAYLVPASTPPPSTSDLRAFLRRALPDYMLPAAFVCLDRLPLTPNGKIDRRALPAPDRARPALDQAFLAPRSPVELELARIWTEVLGLEQVGVQDNFFELGGHSLLATQVISRMRDAFRVELPLRALFENPSIAQLASTIEQAEGEGHRLRPPPISALPREPYRAQTAPDSFALPASFAQQRLWFLDRMEPGSPAYNIPAALRLAGPLDVTALERSLSELVRRHETLRTTFETGQSGPVQVISPPEPCPLPVIDLRRQPETEARRIATEEARRPFDLRQGPLLRATLLRLGREEHILLLTMHHIVSDEWSMGVLYRELTALYNAFAGGAPSPLPELPVQYADFALWQREWLQGEALEAQLAYWQEQLAGASARLPTLELPTDRPRPPVQTFRGATQSITIPRALQDSLAGVGQEADGTLYMALLAAFEVLLYRYTGQADLVVGTPIANRNRAEIEGLIGFFVNTLVLRADLAGDPSFRELLARVRETALGAYAHQDLPFEKLVEALQPERDLSRNPLFQVMFVYQNVPMQQPELSGLSVTPVEVDHGTAKFDLTLTIFEEAAGLKASFEYNTDLFDADTITRLAGHFQTLLAGIVADPDAPISRLPILTEAERGRLLHEWSRTRIDYPRRSDHCLSQRFEAQVARTPEAIALTFEGEHLTYRQLNARANQLAHHLRTLGIGPDALVGVCLERSPEMVVAILGVLKAGGAYVPLDLAYPQERLAFILEDTRTTVLLTDSRLLERLPDQGTLAGLEPKPHVICLDTDWPAIARESVENPPGANGPEDLAYVIYTSGSTGQPKGVLNTHFNVTRLFDATQPWYHFDDRDVWTLFHSYAFDFSVWELWGALLHGGRLVVVPYWISRSAEAFYDLLRSEGVTVLNQTPSAFRQLIQAEETLGVAGDLALRLVIFGGEALELNSLKPWFDRHGDQRPQLVNMYGITETTVHVTYRPLTQADLDEAPGSLIGGPIPDLEIYILDEHLQPVPAGVPGELFIGGPGLARGYLNRPHLTRQRFIPHPFSNQPLARLYRSGDRARFLPNGDILFLGRLDHQVKVRGFRIELGEIEARLAQHPALQQALVIARQPDHDPLDTQLVAYLVPASTPPPSTSDLRAFLRRALPDYMLPAAFVCLDRLPLTPNGKIDRRALPAPDRARPALDQAFLAPRSPVELELARIWTEVLGLEQVGVQDNFFELGGHSLLATQVISRMRDAFRVELPLRALFENPSIAQLASTIEQAEVEQADSETLAEILAELEQLSEEDARARLVLEGGSSND